MKKILLGLFLFWITTSNAQLVDWARQGSDVGNSRSYGMGSDGSGNLYTTGSISSPTLFDTIILNGNGGLDVVVAKYNRLGDIQWAVSFGGTGNDEALDISTDLMGNSYVTGYFGTNAIIGVDTFVSPYFLNFFICKINSSGIIQWVNRFDNPGGASEGRAVSVDNFGQQLAVTGFFRYSSDLDSINLIGNYEDVFTCRLNPQNGSPLWIRTGGGAVDDEGEGVAIDNQGNVIISGYYKLAATFDTVTFSVGGDKDAFLISYDTSGSILWTQTGIGPGSDAGYRVIRDNLGNTYMEGHYSNGVNFDGIVLTSHGGFDGFINRYDVNGNLDWIIHGGSQGNGLEFFSGLAFDNYGFLWCIGGFNGIASFDTFQVATQGADMVLCRIDTGGHLLNVLNYGSPGDDYGVGMAGLGYGLAYSPECFMTIAGGFSGTANFGGVNLTSGGGDDACIIHIDVTCTIGIHEENYSEGLKVFPNPVDEILLFTSDVLDHTSNTIISVYNLLGEKIFTQPQTGTQVNVGSLRSGIYILEIVTHKTILREKFLKE